MQVKFTPSETIEIHGARQHNLKHVSVSLPKHQLLVMCGLSGSGKSSFAFDTLYAEGQRRYVESLSSYVRQFLEQVPKPDVDSIEGLPPAVAVQQKSPGHNPRSTVGTLTEIHDYLRLLYARIGTPHCPECGKPVGAQSIPEMVEQVMALPEGTRLLVLAPLHYQLKGTDLERAMKQAQREGFVRARLDGEEVELTEALELDLRRRRQVEITVDRLVVKSEARARLADSLELALRLAQGVAAVVTTEGKELLFSEAFACVECGLAFKQLEPENFSPNSPAGMCEACNGLGFAWSLDPGKVIPDKRLSLAKGAVVALGDIARKHPDWLDWLEKSALALGFDRNTPLEKVPAEALQEFLYNKDGLMTELDHASRHGSPGFRRFLGRFVSNLPCRVCKGAKLRAEAIAVTVNGLNLPSLQALTLSEAAAFLSDLKLSSRQQHIVEDALAEARSRLTFLLQVGVGYLSLDRGAPTLSGGEYQRINLASQLGSGLTGVLYVLDEPSIGLHPRDTHRLLQALIGLRDLGNSVVVIEHDRDVIAAADRLYEFGPGPGEQGGSIVTEGTPVELTADTDSLTGKYLSGQLTIEGARERLPLPDGKWLEFTGITHRNLKAIDIAIPPGRLMCVTGVSGSGKSSLVQEVVFPALANLLLGRPRYEVGAYKEMNHASLFDRVLSVDQAGIGSSPRSNAAVYVGAFSHIRDLFSRLPFSRQRGWKPGRFSFNAPGGRCESCQGLGVKLVEMHFLADVWVPCEVCQGKRYNQETLRARYNGKNIYEILELTVDEGMEFFSELRAITSALSFLQQVGLGYLRLGQPGNTLSGGEAQRVKLALELSKPATGRTLYLLDEPTTGLHFEDVRVLLVALDKLVSAGNTVVVIEHNLDFIKAADFLVDLGPEGGEGGGQVVARGTPEEIAQTAGSHTGDWLAGRAR